MRDNQRGASILEVILAIGIVAAMTPFIYSRISEMTRNIRDISDARLITKYHASVSNFARIKSIDWDVDSFEKIPENDLNEIAPGAVLGIVDKTQNFTDVYLMFATNPLRGAKIANVIGDDAGIVGPDNIVYGSNWAAHSSDFIPGYLIYRVSNRNIGFDTTRFLHRVGGEDTGLNKMQRDLNMGGFDMIGAGIGTIVSMKSVESETGFIETDVLNTVSTEFAGGANMASPEIKMKNISVFGDINGFREIGAGTVNQTMRGGIIAERTIISNELNVSGTLTVKSDYANTISGFYGISLHSLNVPYLSTNVLEFGSGFGISISGELLRGSGGGAFRFGRWDFPKNPIPTFNKLILENGTISILPDAKPYEQLMQSGWKNARINVD